MFTNNLVFTLFLIFTGTAIFSTIALWTRQSLLVAYIVLGAVLGPWGLRWINDAHLVQETGDIGIIFLLFLLGLHLQPQNLIHMLRRTTWVTLISSLIFAIIGYGVSYLFGFNHTECLIIGITMMFSSTIIGLKLLPTTVLHHQHTGEIMISVLLMQDLIAIATLLFIHGSEMQGYTLAKLGLILLSLPALLLFVFTFERFILVPLFKRFDRIREYLFLLAIAWCLSVSVLANLLGLSYEIGAFIAGVSIAVGPIALYMAESLKPVRDFFLVMFFFSIGAEFNFQYLGEIALPTLMLASILLIVKPITFWALLRQVHESRHLAMEIGMRLNQISEFSLLIGYVAVGSGLIHAKAGYLIQATTIVTFIISSYVVVLRYPTPVAFSDELRRD